MRGSLKDYYLEGILYNTSSDNGLYLSLDEFVGQTATSQGLAKVFVALCSIEGIDAIKVNGQTQIDVDNTIKTINYSWNKVYIDIEEDGYEGKKWYNIDLGMAIQDTMSVRKSGITTVYQFALHKYFLIMDTDMSIQATTLHKRLGDSTDYVANTQFDYYLSQRYSCVYNNTTIVNNANFKVANDTDMVNVLMHAMLKANKKHRLMIDIDAQAYINLITGGATSEEAISSVTTRITGSVYETARTTLGGKYNCTLNIKIVDARYIVIAVQP